MMSEQLTKLRAEERQYLKALMECIQFLARQGLPLRGSDHIDGNVTQLLLLRSKDNPTIFKKLSSVTGANNRKFTHQDYQNELLNLMANEVLRTNLNAIKQSKFYSTMCDEYTDVANKEQLSFCLRWIDENLCAREDFLGYYELPNIKSDTIVAVIRDCLIRFELPIQNLRRQTYDGASNMMGKRSGVAQQILKDQPKALVTHCHGHSLSLAIKDANKLCSILNEVMESVGEIIVLIKFSPKTRECLGQLMKILKCQMKMMMVFWKQEPLQPNYQLHDGLFDQIAITRYISYRTPGHDITLFNKHVFFNLKQVFYME